MAERTLTVRLRAVVDGYERALEGAARTTDQLADRADRMSRMAGQATKVGGELARNVTLPLGIAGAGVVKFAGDFEAGMREVQALTGATASEMEMLSGQAKKLGMETQFSAGQAADAMGQLVKGGFDVRQTYAALPGVMQLAAAATLDIASAADVATNVLSGYGMAVEDLGRVNDVLAQTANASDTDVRELGEAFKMVGPVARSAGMGFEETSATLALLAENGIRGTMAGTALRGMIASLLAPSGAATTVLDRLGVSVTDAQGQLLPMTDIVEQFAAAGATTSDVYQVFGREVAGSMSALLGSGAPALERMTALLEESGGTAERLASAKMGGLNGSIESLRGSLEGLAIEVGGKGGVSAFIQSLASGATALTNAMASAPAPLVKTGVAIAGLAAASGPAIWAAGKMATMYGPVVSGIRATVGWLQTMRLQMALAQAQGISTGGALATMFGPQAAVLVGVAALAGLMYLAKRQADEWAASHIAAGDAAMQLAESANIATRELGALHDAQERGVVGTDDFRKANEEAIATLRRIADEDLQQSFLLEIGYQMVLRGGSPEDAVEAVRRLANAAGVDVPVSLTVQNVDDFENQVQAAVDRAKGLMSDMAGNIGAGQLTEDVRADLDAIASAAADAWKTDNVAGFAQILAAAEAQLGDNVAAIEHLSDRTLELTEVQGLSTMSTGSAADALRQMAGEASLADAEQKKVVDGIMQAAAAMDGGLTPANLAAAAAQRTAGRTASEYGDKAAKAADGTGDLAGATGEAADAMAAAAKEGGIFGDQLEAVARQARLGSLAVDAAASAADAFSRSIEQSTSLDDQLSAGLQAGRALQSLRAGLKGESDAADQASKKTDAAAEAVEQLGDALSRTDPKLSEAGIRLGGLAAAADAYRTSIDQSTGLDDQISSALSLGEAYTAFRRSVRRLPADFDTVGASLGRYRKSQTTAIQNVAQLGKATTDYLATLISSGAGHERVRAEAGRLRGEYEAQMRQAGLTGDAVARYLEVLGLTPRQVETALKVSGQEQARFQIQAYMGLLEGRIPAEVATGVVASIESGNLDGAARQLATWAKTNPVEVRTEVDGEVTGKDGKPVKWELPADFDPLVAAMGGYTDAQQRGIEGLQQLGDATGEYLASLIGAGEPERARDAADLLRQAYHDQLAQLGLNEDQIGRYLEVLGLTPAQVETAIVVSGDEEARFKIETYSALLSEEIPPEVSSEVLTLIDEGKLGEAADRLKRWRESESGKTITIGVAVGQPGTGLFGILPSFTPTVTQPGQGPFGLIPSAPRPTTLAPKGRAHGGPVAADETYRVLEHGRAELFTPTVPGTITPLSQLMTPAPQRTDPALAQALGQLAASPASLHLDLGGVTVVSPRSEPTPEAIIRGVSSKVYDETGLSLAGVRR